MFEHCQMELRAGRTILKDAYSDKHAHQCVILNYDEDTETFLLNTDMEETKKYALDNLYECRIVTGEGNLFCHGIIKERFWDKRGGIVKLTAQDGFYKSL